MADMTTPIAKRAHKKSRKGCRQCKQRKVKCDESWPVCGNCAKHFSNAENCDYGISSGPPSNAPVQDAAYSLARVRTSRLGKGKKAIHSHFIAPKHVLALMPGGGIDPFATYPGSQIPDAQVFMQHYFMSFASKGFPLVIGNNSHLWLQTWWSMASEDAVLFHATLQLSALDLETLQSGGEALRSTQLLNRECIRLLRKRVEDPIHGVSDQTIGSVLFLAIVEYERDNMRMVRMHIEGLKRIISIRGGLEALRASNPQLANMAFGVSMVVMTEAQFSPDTEDSEMLRILPDNHPDTPPFNFESLGVARPHARLLQKLRYITIEASSTWPRCPAPVNCCELLVRLVDLAIPHEDGPIVAAVSECCRIAAIILCFFPFRDYPSPDLLINVHLYKLKASLEHMALLAPLNHDLLLWLFSVGGMVSSGPERRWFVGHLASIISERNIRSWEEMKPHLEKIIWVEHYCGPLCKEFWEEADIKMRTLELVDLDAW